MNERRHAQFVELIRDAAQPMEPLPAPPLPEAFQGRLFPGAIPALTGLKAVVFDIYGTLFSSAAGDIGVTMDYVRGNLDSLALQYTEDRTGEELKAYFRTAVMEEHGRHYGETPYPEVRVEELWAALPGRYSDRDPAELALRYELAVNPVFPMPGAGECIAALRAAGLRLGLVSNAQFFTPLLFEAYFGAPPEELGFDPELTVFSYQMLRAKPSPDLFAPVLRNLGSFGISAGDCVYVGNDMLNDVFGAADSGFRTALFAGDGRSLRLRETNRLCAGLLPDAVLRRLEDLPALVGGVSCG